MSEAPAEVWLRQSTMGHWFGSHLDPPEPDAVRYVRADLYDKRMAEYVNQEPLGELGKGVS